MLVLLPHNSFVTCTGSCQDNQLLFHSSSSDEVKKLKNHQRSYKTDRFIKFYTSNMQSSIGWDCPFMHVQSCQGLCLTVLFFKFIALSNWTVGPKGSIILLQPGSVACDEPHVPYCHLQSKIHQYPKEERTNCSFFHCLFFSFSTFSNGNNIYIFYPTAFLFILYCPHRCFFFPFIFSMLLMQVASQSFFPFSSFIFTLVVIKWIQRDRLGGLDFPKIVCLNTHQWGFAILDFCIFMGLCDFKAAGSKHLPFFGTSETLY